MRVAPSLPLRKEVLNKELKAHAQRAKFDIGMRQHHNGQARACATYSNQGPNQGSVLQATCLHQNDTVGDGTLPHAHLPHAYASSGETQGRGPAYCAGSNSVPAKGSATQSLAQSLADMHPAEAVPVYVMLPLDTVNAQGVFRYAYIPWFAQALQVLALSGVHGVAVDVWWCAVERSPRQYSWTGYRQLFEMVRGAGLKLQVVLSFHACGGNVGDLAQVPLPSWVLEAGQQDPDIFFTDRPRECGLGQRNKEYLSIWADECLVLPGGSSGAGGRRSPLQAYAELMAAFRDAFTEQLGSLVEEVVVGAGPCGELRYPSYVEANGWRFPGVGEFQCYDRHALASLAAAAAAAGRPEWGYTGPHDSGGYNSSPGDTGFFAPGGSWGTEYGDFFLNWYSSCLLQHGDRLLHVANHVFGPHKEATQPLDGTAVQAHAVVRRLQSLIMSNDSGNGIGSGTCDGLGSCSNSSSSSLTAVAAAATVAAAAAASGMNADVSNVAAAARQAKGLLQHVQHLQLQHSFTPSIPAAKSSSSSSSSSDDEGGSSAAPSPSIGSAAATPISCSSASASTSCLTPQDSLPVLLQLPEQQHIGSAGVAAASVWDHLDDPQAQALATSILQQLQLQDSSDAGSGLALMAADAAAAGAAAAAAGSTCGYSAAGGCATAAAVAPNSSGFAQDLPLAELLSSSPQCLAGLSLTCNGSSSSSSEISSSLSAPAAGHAASTAAVAAVPSQQAVDGAAGAAGGLPAARAASMAGVALDAAAAAAAAAASSSSNNSSSVFTAAVSGGSCTGPTAAAAAAVTGESLGSIHSSSSDSRKDFAGSSSGGSAELAAVPATAAAAAAGAADQTSAALLQSFLIALSGLGFGVDGAGVQQQAQRRWQQQQQQQGLVLTLKIAGVHWWYNSTSHASELTAGYYNTGTRDGYSPILQLCERHGVNLTLTCVEMCDAQHPSYALCGPEGLLRQIRAMAARQQVMLSGENALPIFTPCGVDAVALDRVVCNVRACRTAPLRSCSSWPGPAMTSGSSSSGPGSSAAAAYVADASGGCSSSKLGYGQYHPLQQQCSVVGDGGSQHSVLAMGVHGGYHHLDSYGQPLQRWQQQQQQQQQNAHHHHYWAGVGGGGNILSTGRTFSEFGTLLGCIAAAGASSSWHEQQQQASGAPGSSKGLCGAAGGVSAAAAISGHGSAGAGGRGGAVLGEVVVLPAMRAFTFLRLGPEILRPDCHASWMRFMHRMLNEQA